MPINFRRPIWICFVVFCLVAGLYSWFYFSEAFPIVNLDITMDREAALRKAEKLARSRELGPKQFNQAASFDHDNQAQSFVELEAGGKDQYREMISKGYYHPYQWHVRHYRPAEIREIEFRFTPSGEIYGFKEKWPEDDTGAAIKSNRAQQIAENHAVNQWNVNLKKYELLSSGQKERSSGRVDHTFIYERENLDLKEGNYRLRLGVNGSQLSEVTYFVKIPEGFTRRYSNMRSANSLIQNVGNVFVYVVYLLVGCLFGAYWLLKNNSLKWRKALFWGGGITLLLFLSRINSLPLQWMNYDTAMTPESFLAQQIVSALSSTLLFGVIITITFIASEGLTREAFQHHPKLWKLWNPTAAGSNTVGSLTLFGYFLVGPYFAYNVALYSFAYDSFNWWSPSNLLYDPNILAHYATWLKPVVNSLRAGFWEECLFRAVPIAGAALLGRRYGRRRWWIGTVLVLQALIFGAGHASYATQPSYARVVELFSSSIAMGLIYIGYGLLPTVMAHYLYDLILMALPLFVSNAPGVWMSQSFVVLFGLVPGITVLWGWYQNGQLISLPDPFWNYDQYKSGQSGSQDYDTHVPAGLDLRHVGIVLVVGLMGFLSWGYYGTFESNEIPITDTKEEAEEHADSLLKDTGDNPRKWMQRSIVRAEPSRDDAFVWQEGGEDAYRQLMGSYLTGPYWMVRYFRFQGSVEARAEEYKIRLNSKQNLEEIQHYLPESASGDSLTETEAMTIADSAVKTNYGMTLNEMKKISAEPTPRPSRRDWVVEYEISDDNPLNRGETRVRVTMLGSKVTDTSRYFHIPETWERNNRNRKQLVNLIGTTADTLLYLFVLAGAFVGIVYWGRGWDFSARAAFVTLGFLIILTLVQTVNQWPTILAGFDTAEPFWNQIFIVLSRRISFLLRAVVIALVAGLVHGKIGLNQSVSFSYSLTTGLSLGVSAAGIVAFSSWLAPDLIPQWGSYSSVDKLIPWIHPLITEVNQFLVGTLLLMLFSVGYFQLTRGGIRYRRTAVFLAAIFGLILASNGSFTSLTEWGVRSLLYALFISLISLGVLLRDRSFIPIAMAAVLVMKQLTILLTSSHIYVIPSVLMSIFIILGIASYWMYILQQLQIKNL